MIIRQADVEEFLDKYCYETVSMFSASVGHGGANHRHGQDQLRGHQDFASAVWRCQCSASAAKGGSLMRIAEIRPAKPLTPDQQRIRAMQARVKQAQQAVKAERARQEIQRAQLILSKSKNV